MKNAILIVDDSRLNRETLADILKDKYNIIEAEDGRSGLEVLEKRKDDIVLVILDIVMPGMGWIWCPELYESSPLSGRYPGYYDFQ